MARININADFDEIEDIYGGIEPIIKTKNTDGIYKKDPYDENVYESQREHTKGRKSNTYIGTAKKERKRHS